MLSALISKIVGHSGLLVIYTFLCRAYESYTLAYFKGDDGEKPDWLARKACNYLTESVQVIIMTRKFIQQRKTRLQSEVLSLERHWIWVQG